MKEIADEMRQQSQASVRCAKNMSHRHGRGRPRVSELVPLASWIREYLGANCGAADRQRHTGTYHSIKTVPEMHAFIKARLEMYNKAYLQDNPVDWSVYHS